MNKKNYLAPVVLFTYNRIDHLKKTINSLKKNELSKQSELIIFSDNSKSNDDLLQVNKVRGYIRKISGFKNVKIHYRKYNFGLSKNITSGVTQILKKYSKIIIIEDDLVFNKHFLKYMNDGLEVFKKNTNVASIHAYIYPIKFEKSFPEFFFLKGADCWGWGTWRRAWKKFDYNGMKLKKKLIKKKLINEFNFNNTYDYYKMLNDQINRKNDSWAIRWYASAFLNNMLTLYPKYSFVNNIGTDGSGTHGSSKKTVNKILSRKKFQKIKSLNLKTKENYNARKKVEKYFKDNSDFFLKKIIKKII